MPVLSITYEMRSMGAKIRSLLDLKSSPAGVLPDTDENVAGAEIVKHRYLCATTQIILIVDGVVLMRADNNVCE